MSSLGQITAAPILRLAEHVDDKVTLCRPSGGVRFHLNEHCTKIPEWQPCSHFANIPVTALDTNNLCPHCTSNLVQIAEFWSRCPTMATGPRQIVLGRTNGPFYILRPCTQLLKRTMTALGAQFTDDDQGNQRFVAVVPSDLVSWLRTWLPLTALSCAEPLTPDDTKSTLELAQGLWAPSTNSALADPLVALAAARQLTTAHD